MNRQVRLGVEVGDGGVWLGIKWPSYSRIIFNDRLLMRWAVCSIDAPTNGSPCECVRWRKRAGCGGNVGFARFGSWTWCQVGGAGAHSDSLPGTNL